MIKLEFSEACVEVLTILGSKNEHSFIEAITTTTSAAAEKFKHDLTFVPFDWWCIKNEKLYFDRRTAWFGLRYKKWWKNCNNKKKHTQRGESKLNTGTDRIDVEIENSHFIFSNVGTLEKRTLEKTIAPEEKKLNRYFLFTHHI